MSTLPSDYHHDDPVVKNAYAAILVFEEEMQLLPDERKQRQGLTQSRILGHLLIQASNNETRMSVARAINTCLGDSAKFVELAEVAKDYFIWACAYTVAIFETNLGADCTKVKMKRSTTPIPSTRSTKSSGTPKEDAAAILHEVPMDHSSAKRQVTSRQRKIKSNSC